MQRKGAKTDLSCLAIVNEYRDSDLKENSEKLDIAIDGHSECGKYFKASDHNVVYIKIFCRHHRKEKVAKTMNSKPSKFQTGEFAGRRD